MQLRESSKKRRDFVNYAPSKDDNTGLPDFVISTKWKTEGQAGNMGSIIRVIRNELGLGDNVLGDNVLGVNYIQSSLDRKEF